MKQHFGKYLGATLIDEQQPLTAWRTWRLGASDKTGRVALGATWAKHKMVWEPNGRATVAQCTPDSNRTPCHLAMQPDCGCGLWAALSITNLLKHGAVALYPVGVLGRVNLWGFVHVYEYGFRAQMGRPRDLWLGNTDGRGIVEELAKVYAVSVDLGLPVETAVHPGLLTPKKVLEAANAYLAGQHVTARNALAAITSTLPVPIRGRRALPRLRVPARRRKAVAQTTVADTLGLQGTVQEVKGP